MEFNSIQGSVEVDKLDVESVEKEWNAIWNDPTFNETIDALEKKVNESLKGRDYGKDHATWNQFRHYASPQNVQHEASSFEMLSKETKNKAKQLNQSKKTLALFLESHRMWANDHQKTLSRGMVEKEKESVWIGAQQEIEKKQNEPFLDRSVHLNKVDWNDDQIQWRLVCTQEHSRDLKRDGLWSLDAGFKGGYSGKKINLKKEDTFWIDLWIESHSGKKEVLEVQEEQKALMKNFKFENVNNVGVKGQSYAIEKVSWDEKTSEFVWIIQYNTGSRVMIRSNGKEDRKFICNANGNEWLEETRLGYYFEHWWDGLIKKTWFKKGGGLFLEGMKSKLEESLNERLVKWANQERLIGKINATKDCIRRIESLKDWNWSEQSEGLGERKKAFVEAWKRQDAIAIAEAWINHQNHYKREKRDQLESKRHEIQSIEYKIQEIGLHEFKRVSRMGNGRRESNRNSHWIHEEVLNAWKGYTLEGLMEDTGSQEFVEQKVKDFKVSLLGADWEDWIKTKGSKRAMSIREWMWMASQENERRKTLRNESVKGVHLGGLEKAGASHTKEGLVLAVRKRDEEEREEKAIFWGLKFGVKNVKKNWSLSVQEWAKSEWGVRNEGGLIDPLKWNRNFDKKLKPTEILRWNDKLKMKSGLLQWSGIEQRQLRQLSYGSQNAEEQIKCLMNEVELVKKNNQAYENASRWVQEMLEYNGEVRNVNHEKVIAMMLEPESKGRPENWKEDYLVSIEELKEARDYWNQERERLKIMWWEAAPKSPKECFKINDAIRLVSRGAALKNLKQDAKEELQRWRQEWETSKIVLPTKKEVQSWMEWQAWMMWGVAIEKIKNNPYKNEMQASVESWMAMGCKIEKWKEACERRLEESGNDEDLIQEVLKTMNELKEEVEKMMEHWQDDIAKEWGLRSQENRIEYTQSWAQLRKFKNQKDLKNITWGQFVTIKNRDKKILEEKGQYAWKKVRDEWEWDDDWILGEITVMGAQDRWSLTTGGKKEAYLWAEAGVRVGEARMSGMLKKIEWDRTLRDEGVEVIKSLNLKM